VGRRSNLEAVDGGNGDLRVEESDVEKALAELLVHGGSLNRKLLGAVARDSDLN
jgi:hypothetical protein